VIDDGGRSVEAIAWSRIVRDSERIYNALREGGTWTVPRSGLKFVKRGRSFHLLSYAQSFDREAQRQELYCLQEIYRYLNIRVIDDAGLGPMEKELPT
jgi:hypothetical protein